MKEGRKKGRKEGRKYRERGPGRLEEELEIQVKDIAKLYRLPSM